MFSYHTQTHEQCVQGNNFTVVNLSPTFRWDEKETARKQISERLYDVFCQYVKDKT